MFDQLTWKFTNSAPVVVIQPRDREELRKEEVQSETDSLSHQTK